MGMKNIIYFVYPAFLDNFAAFVGWVIAKEHLLEPHLKQEHFG